LLQRLAGEGFSADGQMGREGGRGRRVVSQILLEEAQGHASLEEMGGPRVAERVHRGPLGEAAGLQRGTQGLLHAVARHRRRGCGQPDTTTARSRQKPYRVAVGWPVLAEPLQRRVGQWHRAILGAVATAHVDAQAGPSNVGTWQVGALLQAQATGVNSREAGPIPR
jgi:hypothetical protein